MTAVEWFLNELKRMQYFIGNDMLEAYNQALEMERCQKEKMYSGEEVDDLLDRLLEGNMCSVVGEELIERFQKK